MNSSIINPVKLCNGIRCNRYRITCTSGNGRDFLPQFFGDERNDGVGEAQNRFQRANQRAARGALLRGVARVDLHFGDFQIPIAELVPHKIVNNVRDVIQAVIGKSLRDIGFGFLQHGNNPAVGLAKFQITARRALVDGVVG